MDFDPEQLDAYDEHTDESLTSATSSEDEQDDRPRDHYVTVGKSKLRKRDAAPLGPQYSGSKVDREQAFDDESDDPFEQGFEDSDGSDEETLSVKAPRADNSNNETEDETSQEDDDEAESIEDAEAEDGIDRAELHRVMAEEQRNVSATLSQAAQADAAKGRAVNIQRKAFDQLLNVRIRLQKSLVATNSLATKDRTDFADITRDVVGSAEAAAMTLWNSLNDLRATLHQQRTGEKRKYASFAVDAKASSLWSRMQTLQAQERSHHQNVLNRWSAKARGATAALAPARGRLNNQVKEQTLTDVLNAQLLDQDRLIRRTRTPRSCAPVQANLDITESPDIYDDADFYGVLLKELLEQRNAEASVTGLDFNKAPWQAAREVKTKKAVDTKASKGRKLRYTVHEKLQNFMAPEDRTTWGERQVDELFGSLFGRKAHLNEEANDGVSDGEEGLEEAGLMLFRS